MSDLNLYVGCYVQLRNGDVVGPLWSRDHRVYPWMHGGRTWTTRGKFYKSVVDSRDIVCVVDAPINTAVDSSVPSDRFTVTQDILKAASDAGMRSVPTYDLFIQDVVEAAFKLAREKASLEAGIDGGKLFDIVNLSSKIRREANQFHDDPNEPAMSQQEALQIAASIIDQVASENESEKGIGPEVQLESKAEVQSDQSVTIGSLESLHPATVAFCRALGGSRPLKAIYCQGPANRIQATYGRPRSTTMALTITVTAGGDPVAIPMFQNKSEAGSGCDDA